MIEQCVRAHELRTEWFRSFQRYLRDVITPKLDAHDRLLEENHALREQLQALQAKASRRKVEQEVG